MNDTMQDDTGSKTPHDGLDAGGLFEAASSGDGDPSLQALAPLFPSYKLLERIGRGATSSVYRARHRKLDRTVAIKLLDPELASEAGFFERFQREARATATLQHPFVVTVHDFGDVDGVLYLVLEDCGGRTFRQLIVEGEESRRTGIRTLVQVCEALEHAHARGAVHRDLKPENVLIDPHGYPRIADFGLARILEPGTPKLTRSGDVMGTPHYMAPEQLQGRPADQRSDVYAMGVMTYELLTGELPIGRFEGPARGRDEYAELGGVVMECLSSEASERPLLGNLRKALQRTLHSNAVPRVTAPKTRAEREPVDPSKSLEKSDGRAVPMFAVIGGALASVGAMLPGIDILLGPGSNDYLHLAAPGLPAARAHWDLLGIVSVSGWLMWFVTLLSTAGLGACYWTGRTVPKYVVPAFAGFGSVWTLSIPLTLFHPTIDVSGAWERFSVDVEPRYGILVLVSGFVLILYSAFSDWSSDRRRTNNSKRATVVSQSKLREMRRRRRMSQLRRESKQKPR